MSARIASGSQRIVFLGTLRSGHFPQDYFRFRSFRAGTMRIDDAGLKNVVFIGLPKEPLSDDTPLEELNKCVHWGGTGFFVTVLCEDSRGHTYTYLVTAKHVADKIEGRDYILRMNRANGGIAIARPDEGAQWWRHPTNPDGIDVAVFPFLPPPTIADINSMMADEWFLTPEIIKQRQIGPGDTAFTIGLFSLMTGGQKNFPIVRSGHIAMMPDEKIPNVEIGQWTGEAEGYLVEMRSVGGLSGSPVFVRETVRVPIKDEEEKVARGIGRSWLLGLMHGHWEIPPENLNESEIKPRKPQRDRRECPELLHLGFSVVIPSHIIAEVINHPELVKMRRDAVAGTIGDSGTIQDREPGND